MQIHAITQGVPQPSLEIGGLNRLRTAANIYPALFLLGTAVGVLFTQYKCRKSVALLLRENLYCP